MTGRTHCLLLSTHSVLTNENWKFLTMIPKCCETLYHPCKGTLCSYVPVGTLPNELRSGFRRGCICGCWGQDLKCLMEPKLVSTSLCVSSSFLPSQSSTFYSRPKWHKTAVWGCRRFCIIAPITWRYRRNRIVSHSRFRGEKVTGPAKVHRRLEFQSFMTREAGAHCADVMSRLIPAILRAGV